MNILLPVRPPCTSPTFLLLFCLLKVFTRSNIEQAKSATTATFVTALVFNAAVFVAELVAFTILRPYFKAIYEPRTYVPPPS